MPSDSDLLDTTATPQSFHIDKRAGEIAEQGAGDPDDLLTTTEVAEWLRVSTQWVEIGRSKGYGPPFIVLSPRRIRYKRSSVLGFLAERQFASTAKYSKRRTLPNDAL